MEKKKSFMTAVWKGLPGTNALAYFASLSVRRKNVLQGWHQVVKAEGQAPDGLEVSLHGLVQKVHDLVGRSGIEKMLIELFLNTQKY